mgnify:CR=1 FL=1
MAEDILHYIWATNLAVGSETTCPFTHKKMHVTVDFLELMASTISGKQKTGRQALDYGEQIQKKYAGILAKEANPIAEIRHTELYRELFDDYARNLKNNALQPFAEDQRFRDAIKLFGTKEFEPFDTRLKDYITRMVKNLMEKFGYTEQGAKEIALYVLEKNLNKEFAQ